MNQRAGQRAVLLVLAVALAGCQDEPTTYAECILEHLEGKTRSDAEVALLMEICASRFPRSRGVELPAEAIARLEISVERESENSLEIRVYNPTEWTLSELRFQVGAMGEGRSPSPNLRPEEDPGWDFDLGGEEGASRIYREPVQVRPESVSYVTIRLFDRDPLSVFGSPRVQGIGDASTRGLKVISASGRRE